MIARLTALHDGKRVDIGEGRDRLIVPASVDDLAEIYDAHPEATLVSGATDVGLWVTKFMREIGPISPLAPQFPHAATPFAPLRAAAEKQGRLDFTNVWAGQAVRLGRDMPAAKLTRALAGSALARLSKMAG